MSDCLFCKIIAGEIPSSKVYEDSFAMPSTTLPLRHPPIFWWCPRPTSSPFPL